MGARRTKIGRRGLIVGGAALATAAVTAVEYESFAGRFDHRRQPPRGGPAATSRERYQKSIAALGAETNAIVHVAHSTHLLVVDGVRLLTDPWFYDPAFGALGHEVSPAVVPSEIGRLDAILVTHDHADHADFRAIDQMDKRAVVVVATKELAARAKQAGFRDAVVLAAWEERVIGSVTVTAVPGLHDIYEVGFVVRGPVTGKSVYFAGDTRLYPELPAVAERFRPDVAILPVDGTRLIGGAQHVMTPDDAVSAARTLGSKLVLPSHAEAVFTDPIAEHILASTVARARFVFHDLVARSLTGVRCVVPEAGEAVQVA